MGYVEAFDHFVVPVDDIVAAEEFYTRVFDGPIVGRNGLNVWQRQRDAVPHTFIRVAGKRIGVYLQSEERPAPASVRGSPTYSFETTAHGLDETRAALQAWGTAYEGPVARDHAFAERALYFNDPAGNHYSVYVPPDGSAANEATRPGERMTRVGYLELEAPDLQASIRCYEDVLGFELEGYGEDPRQEARQATMRLPSGQVLILTDVPFAPKGLIMSRTVPGPHLGFRIPAVYWQTALARLEELGIPNGDRGAAKVRRPGEGGTYMDDPAGYVIQYITDGME
jgi:catechol 2,3-dioxygenase-like lactoylglutathione lyase family enzyme